MNIALIQTSIIWENVDANINRYTPLIEKCEGADLILLPETFCTGFSMRPELFAIETETKIVPWLISLSNKTGAAITGSAMREEAGKYYNTLYFVKPDGELHRYDKRHLFTPGEESAHYSKGKERLIVEWRGWRICPLICYDLRFPVFSRNDKAYDLLIYVANWPAVRDYAWQQLLKARAIENQTYVVACNRTGSEPGGMEYKGNSCIVNYMGEDIGFGDKEDVFMFTLNKEPLMEFRTRFPVLDDMDSFTIH
jgi:predicted amidohydrolase